MSNHYHLLVTDPDARLPEFVYILNKYVAKCMNAHHGRWENFWAGGTQASFVHLADDEDIVSKTAYTVANPVEAGLVSRSVDWPGFLLWRPGVYMMKRPDVFFREGGFAKDGMKLRVTPPPLLSCRDQRSVMERVGNAVSERQRVLRAARRAVGKTFLGVQRVLTQRITSRPQAPAPRRGLSPRLAAHDKWRRVELLQRLKRFVQEHRDAFSRWLAGEEGVRFPAGTYQLRVDFGVACVDD